MDTGVVIVAAGSGKRMGAERNKLWLLLGGEPIWTRTVRLFTSHPEIGEVVLVVNSQDHDEILAWIHQEQLKVTVVLGGAERQDSVKNGLTALSSDCSYVLVHDAARPFVTSEQISEMIRQVRLDGASIMAVPVKDTMKVVGADGIVQSTPARESLWAVQTPQAFLVSLLKEAHEAAAEKGKTGTDDAMLVEWLGHAVSVVRGSYENIKITTPDDLWFGEEILRRRKGERA
ncbi:2-C-methyl-D-erythritol 4-phosphate cytidylyltransferase [Brevibacillus ruminantium]|uniref:2-C-methyl-D-erythritol 4-phosphate cytidylyltransferase n=1 Tax=Brevibacillus ruminantium TaxID=2950604 RepID=A0ABY4WIP0_9BACL|nr:2-C-methyl-D-erythritol 4-phosphate cytidylyltransferase [Brevibacillus ruminantium]USG66023.1 2-C-methyl-D-erythritol 4-phosphate cytidylyltransferase [Brevibacillus ruminantium]